MAWRGVAWWWVARSPALFVSTVFKVGIMAMRWDQQCNAIKATDTQPAAAPVRTKNLGVAAPGTSGPNNHSTYSTHSRRLGGSYEDTVR